MRSYVVFASVITFCLTSCISLADDTDIDSIDNVLNRGYWLFTEALQTHHSGERRGCRITD